MKPIELSRYQSETHLMTVSLYLDPTLFWFAGHFDVQPLLPGVAQLDWVMHFAKELVGEEWRFKGIQSVKFQLPLLPEHKVQLHLDWNGTKEVLSFRYTLDNNDDQHAIIASQGKIKLCR